MDWQLLRAIGLGIVGLGLAVVAASYVRRPEAWPLGAVVLTPARRQALLDEQRRQQRAGDDVV